MDDKTEHQKVQVQSEQSSNEVKEQKASNLQSESSKDDHSLKTNISDSDQTKNSPLLTPSNAPRSYTIDVNPIFLDTLIEMGFPENRAKKALILTGNMSTEMAMNWLLEHIDDPDVDKPLTDRTIGTHSIPLSSPHPNIFSTDLLMQSLFAKSTTEYKLVLCVREDLKMGIGKIAAQCCHATLGIYKRMKQYCPGLLSDWEKNGEKKIVVRVKDLQTLNELESKAVILNLPTYKVQDAGRTQVPVGTTTVLAIAGPENTVDQVTGHLKLL